MSAALTAETSAARVVASVARLLAESGGAAYGDVLALAVASAGGAFALTLRATDGEMLATAGVAAPPGLRRRLDLPVRCGGEIRAVLSASAAEPLTAADGELLATIADLLALAPPVLPAADAGSVARLVLDVEADLAVLAADLDESLGAALVALRHTDPARVAAAVSAALDALRRLRRHLRATALDDGLRAAVHALAEPGVTVRGDDAALDTVPLHCAVVVERVAEVLSRNAVRPVEIHVSHDEQVVKLSVAAADNTLDASELDRWRRRAEALRGELRERAGRVELHLPVGPLREGHHDHRPDL